MTLWLFYCQYRSFIGSITSKRPIRQNTNDYWNWVELAVCVNAFISFKGCVVCLLAIRKRAKHQTQLSIVLFTLVHVGFSRILALWTIWTITPRSMYWFKYAVRRIAAIRILVSHNFRSCLLLHCVLCGVHNACTSQSHTPEKYMEIL